MEAAFSGTIIILVIIGSLFYFLPTIVGCAKHQPNKGAIFALNLFLGWSLIGWVISLVWALKKPVVQQIIVTNAPNQTTGS
ncbi:MAG: superinfection immunity protein [Clostridiales bacterium]|jgi:hypothetical protein|nr:superinfection immunity protein [Clostridiales bacterium]